MGWAAQEFETIDLGDPRLNRRAVLLAERLGQKPGASILGACGNWAETAAAYRFLRNEQVSCEEVLAAHRQATMARIREHAVVLFLQDTTELDYNGQAVTGLGPLSYEAPVMPGSSTMGVQWEGYARVASVSLPAGEKEDEGSGGRGGRWREGD